MLEDGDCMSGVPLDDLVNEILPEIIQIRRKIHENPELGFEEFETSKLIATYLKDLGLEMKEGVAKTGVVAILRPVNPKKEKTLLIRADMDALPLQEETDEPFRSRNPNKMHACAHDSHVAMILGVANILTKLKDQLQGNVKFVFQPAEEGPGGARPMIREGVLKDPDVTAAIALHVDSKQPTGKIALRKGYVTASADDFHITLKGPGGHGSAPHMTKDLVLIGSQLVLALHALPTREVDPLEPVVLTIGRFSAGTRHNIIGDSALLEGTLRTFNEEVRQYLLERIRETVDRFADLYGIEVSIDINPNDSGYSAGWNDPEFTELVAKAIKSNLGDDVITWEEKPIMGAEDFFEFGLNKSIPTCMFFVGTKNEEKGCVHSMHSSHFKLDEDCLPIGIKAMVSAALSYLKE